MFWAGKYILNPVAPCLALPFDVWMKSEKSHVIIKRVLDNDAEKAFFYLNVDGVDYEFPVDMKDRATTTPYSTYMGAYIIWVAGEYSSSTVQNFVFRSNVQ